jgi:mono/diheme cytochrome c family protein
VASEACVFGVEVVDGEEQGLVEHSAACFARLRAFRTGSYNFRSRKKPDELTREATACPWLRSCILKRVKKCSIWRDVVPVLAAIAVVSGVCISESRHAFAVAAAAAQQSPAHTGASYAQVAPILQSRCVSCHNPQGGAPFSLLTYDDAKQWSGQILEVTQNRYMPPWLPAPGKGDFIGERRLSDAELEAIRTWVGGGAPGPGSAGATASEAPEWPLGKPDAVLTLTEPVALPGNGQDLFTNLVVPFTGDQARRLRAIQIRPSDPQAVRSVLLSFDESGSLRGTDGWKQGIAGMEPPEVMADRAATGTAGLIFWSPGSQELKPRPDEIWTVKPGSDLLLTTHLKTTGKKLALQFQIGLYYAAKTTAGAGRTSVVRLAHRGAIEIPAGTSSTTLEDSYILPQAAAVTAIYPRAHFLARSFDTYATAPGGKQVWLLSIPKWDVDWVEVYRYRRPVLLPKGSVIHWKITYDNSAENPHNPSDPAVVVHGGSGAADETDALLLEMEPAAGTNAVTWRKAMESAAK